MAQPGRKPTPPRLKVIRGNPGKRSIPEAPEPPPAAPDEPDWRQFFPGNRTVIRRLRADARAWWRDKVEVLDGLGLLSTLDDMVLADAAVCWARLLQIERRLTDEGLTRADRKERGQVRHPLSPVAKQYREQLKFYVAELGLAPSSRGRLPAMRPAEGGEEDLD